MWREKTLERKEPKRRDRKRGREGDVESVEGKTKKGGE